MISIKFSSLYSFLLVLIWSSSSTSAEPVRLLETLAPRVPVTSACALFLIKAASRRPEYQGKQIHITQIPVGSTYSVLHASEHGLPHDQLIQIPTDVGIYEIYQYRSEDQRQPWESDPDAWRRNGGDLEDPTEDSGIVLDLVDNKARLYSRDGPNDYFLVTNNRSFSIYHPEGGLAFTYYLIHRYAAFYRLPASKRGQISWLPAIHNELEAVIPTGKPWEVDEFLDEVFEALANKLMAFPKYSSDLGPIFDRLVPLLDIFIINKGLPITLEDLFHLLLLSTEGESDVQQAIRSVVGEYMEQEDSWSLETIRVYPYEYLSAMVGTNWQNVYSTRNYPKIQIENLFLMPTEMHRAVVYGESRHEQTGQVFYRLLEGPIKIESLLSPQTPNQAPDYTYVGSYRLTFYAVRMGEKGELSAPVATVSVSQPTSEGGPVRVKLERLSSSKIPESHQKNIHAQIADYLRARTQTTDSFQAPLAIFEEP